MANEKEKRFVWKILQIPQLQNYNVVLKLSQSFLFCSVQVLLFLQHQRTILARGTHTAYTSRKGNLNTRSNGKHPPGASILGLVILSHLINHEFYAVLVFYFQTIISELARFALKNVLCPFTHSNVPCQFPVSCLKKLFTCMLFLYMLTTLDAPSHTISC